MVMLARPESRLFTLPLVTLQSVIFCTVWDRSGQIHTLVCIITILNTDGESSARSVCVCGGEIHTVPTQLNSAAFIKFLLIRMRRLFEGGVYS